MRYEYIKRQSITNDIERIEYLDESDVIEMKFHRDINAKTDKALAEIEVLVSAAKRKLNPKASFDINDSLGQLGRYRNAAANDQRLQQLYTLGGNPHFNGQASQQISRNVMGMLGFGGNLF